MDFLDEDEVERLVAPGSEHLGLCLAGWLCVALPLLAVLAVLVLASVSEPQLVSSVLAGIELRADLALSQAGRRQVQASELRGLRVVALLGHPSRRRERLDHYLLVPLLARLPHVLLSGSGAYESVYFYDVLLGEDCLGLRLSLSRH